MYRYFKIEMIIIKVYFPRDLVHNALQGKFALTIVLKLSVPQWYIHNSVGRWITHNVREVRLVIIKNLQIANFL